MTDRDRQFWNQWDRWRFDPRLAPWRAYGAAAAIFLVAFVARLLLDPALPGRLPFITFFPAVLLAAFFGGTLPGIAVLLASAIVGSLWLEPAGESPGVERLLGFILFLGIGGIQVGLLHTIDRAVRRIRQDEHQLEVINRELKHRMKNLFAVTESIFRQSLRLGGTPEELRRSVSERVHAIAAAQDLLSATADEGSSVEALIKAVVAPLAPHPSRLVVQGPRAMLSAEKTTTFALMLHELATNATKHGAWRGEAGSVVITWTLAANGAATPLLAFDWTEEGGAAPSPATRSGFGTLLLRTGLPGARVAHELRPVGLHCRIEIPTAAPPPAPDRPAGFALSSLI